MTKIDIIERNGKLFYFFDTYNTRKIAYEEAYDYRKIYEKSRYIIIAFFDDKPNSKKKYALYLTKVIKVFR